MRRTSNHIQRCRVAACAAILLALSATGVEGAAVTYGIDLSGIDANSGHTLSVVGTITAETTTNSIDSSDLVVLHEGAGAVPLFDGFRLILEMEFEATDTEFRIAALTDPVGTTVWTSDPTPPAGAPFGALTLTETGVYTIQYIGDASDQNSHADVTTGVQLSGSNATGYLVGTAIPEPASAGWLAAATFFALQRRRKRR